MGATSYPYRKATLNDCNGSVEGRWYIVFYVWDVQQRKMVRKRDYSLNIYATAAQRRAFAKERIKSINDLLIDGYHIDTRKKPEFEGDVELATTLDKAVRDILEKFRKTLRHASFLSYSSATEKFLDWAKTNRLSNSNVLSFDRLKAMAYVDYLVVDKQMAGKSVNTKVSFMKSMFNQMLEREIIMGNPFVRIKKRKEIKTYQNLAYTDDEIAQLKKKILEKDPELWTFIQFIFYCYLRPAELCSLTVEHVNLRTGKVFVPANISKNGIEGYVDIPAPFMDYLRSIKFLEGKRGYLFKSKTGNKNSKNAMSRRHMVLRENLGLDPRHTLYAWKHTGIVKAYKAGVDIKSLQRQCRHQSIDQTDTYLKSLGLYDNEVFLLKMPGI